VQLAAAASQGAWTPAAAALLAELAPVESWRAADLGLQPALLSPAALEIQLAPFTQAV